ncbi:MAG: hypothetical protein L0Y35_01175 [Flammeovirgaceae bacterium]|nr:hypothetical protein [Flammeovirgaceae bacterium]
MKKIYLLLFLTIVNGCIPLYVPNARNTPQFEKRNEFSTTLSLGQGLNAFGAYSVSDHLAIGLGTMYANNKSFKEEGKNDYRKQSYGELIAGYYINDEKWCFEIFGGVGRGKGYATDSSYLVSSLKEFREIRGSYTKFILQPSFGMNKKSFKWSLTPRFGLVQFDDITKQVGTQTDYWNPGGIIFFEPSLTLKYHFKDSPLQIFSQGGFNMPYPPGRDPSFEYEPLHLSFGISLLFTQNITQ